MGLFKKKKNAIKKETTFTQAFNEAINEEDNKIKKYTKLKPLIIKFIAGYRNHFDNNVNIYGDLIQLRFKNGKHKYPDGFFALADKLGLNVEPTCSGGYYGGWSGDRTDYGTSFNIRAKSK